LCGTAALSLSGPTSVIEQDDPTPIVQDGLVKRAYRHPARACSSSPSSISTRVSN
jgi:hypothetical protein